MKKNVVQLTAVFKGLVQGVFFRAEIQKKAQKFPVTGYVQNLPDGSVKLVAIGFKEDLLSFVQEVQEKPGAANIEDVVCVFGKPCQDFADFSIKY